MKFSAPVTLAVLFLAASAAAAEKTDKPKPAASPAATTSQTIKVGDTKDGPLLPGVAATKAVKPVDDAHLPDVVASVNGTAIKKADLENAVESIRQQVHAVGMPDVPAERKDEMYRSLLDELIATELLAQEAKVRAFPITDKEIDEFVSKFKDQFPSEQIYQQALKEQGINEEQLKGDVKKQLGIKKLLDKEVMSKVAIDEKAAKKFYDENPDKFREGESVHASHVLITVDKGADEATKKARRKEADQVLADAKAGKDFAGLARDHSGDPGSKDKGGDLGFFAKGEMVPAFEAAAFALKAPGDLSDVVETPYGFHVIKLVEHKTAHTVAFADVKEDITGFLKEKKAGEIAKVYVEGLRKKAKVDVKI